jgi:hypothetical protein
MNAIVSIVAAGGFGLLGKEPRDRWLALLSSVKVEYDPGHGGRVVITRASVQRRLGGIVAGRVPAVCVVVYGVTGLRRRLLAAVGPCGG